MLSNQGLQEQKRSYVADARLTVPFHGCIANSRQSGEHAISSSLSEIHSKDISCAERMFSGRMNALLTLRSNLNCNKCLDAKACCRRATACRMPSSA